MHFGQKLFFIALGSIITILFTIAVYFVKPHSNKLNTLKAELQQDKQEEEARQKTEEEDVKPIPEEMFDRMLPELRERVAQAILRALEQKPPIPAHTVYDTLYDALAEPFKPEDPNPLFDRLDALWQLPKSTKPVPSRH